MDRGGRRVLMAFSLRTVLGSAQQRHEYVDHQRRAPQRRPQPGRGVVWPGSPDQAAGVGRCDEAGGVSARPWVIDALEIAGAKRALADPSVAQDMTDARVEDRIASLRDGQIAHSHAALGLRHECFHALLSPG